MFAPYISVGQHGLYLQSLQNMSSYNELNAAGAQSVKAEGEQEQDLAKKSNRACNISTKETAYNEQAQRRAGCYQDRQKDDFGGRSNNSEPFESSVNASASSYPAPSAMQANYPYGARGYPQHYPYPYPGGMGYPAGYGMPWGAGYGSWDYASMQQQQRGGNSNQIAASAQQGQQEAGKPQAQAQPMHAMQLQQQHQQQQRMQPQQHFRQQQQQQHAQAERDDEVPDGHADGTESGSDSGQPEPDIEAVINLHPGNPGQKRPASMGGSAHAGLMQQPYAGWVPMPYSYAWGAPMPGSHPSSWGAAGMEAMYSMNGTAASGAGQYKSSSAYAPYYPAPYGAGYSGSYPMNMSSGGSVGGYGMYPPPRQQSQSAATGTGSGSGVLVQHGAGQLGQSISPPGRQPVDGHKGSGALPSSVSRRTQRLKKRSGSGTPGDISSLGLLQSDTEETEDGTSMHHRQSLPGLDSAYLFQLPGALDMGDMLAGMGTGLGMGMSMGSMQSLQAVNGGVIPSGRMSTQGFGGLPGSAGNGGVVPGLPVVSGAMPVSGQTSARGSSGGGYSSQTQAQMPMGMCRPPAVLPGVGKRSSECGRQVVLPKRFNDAILTLDSQPTTAQRKAAVKGPSPPVGLGNPGGRANRPHSHMQVPGSTEGGMHGQMRRAGMGPGGGMAGGQGGSIKMSQQHSMYPHMKGGMSQPYDPYDLPPRMSPDGSAGMDSLDVLAAVAGEEADDAGGPRTYSGTDSDAGGHGGGGGGGGRKRKRPAADKDPTVPEKKRKARDPATISKVQTSCVHIMRMVGSKTIFEKEIRSALGNNPDTSKALRLLVFQDKLVRQGAGGRGDPFAYNSTALGLQTLAEINAGIEAAAVLLPPGVAASAGIALPIAALQAAVHGPSQMQGVEVQQQQQQRQPDVGIPVVLRGKGRQPMMQVQVQARNEQSQQTALVQQQAAQQDKLPVHGADTQMLPQAEPQEQWSVQVAAVTVAPLINSAPAENHAFAIEAHPSSVQQAQPLEGATTLPCPPILALSQVPEVEDALMAAPAAAETGFAPQPAEEQQLQVQPQVVLKSEPITEAMAAASAAQLPPPPPLPSADA